MSPSPPKRKRTRKVSSSSHSDNAQDTDSDVGAIRFEPKVVVTSDEGHSPRRPKKRKSLGGAHAIPVHAVSDSGSLDEIDGVPRYRKAKKKVILDSEDDTRQCKRKLIKGIRPPTPEEEDDIVDEQNQVLEARLRSRGKMTVFQKNLEKLKSKKRGETAQGSSSSESEQSEGSQMVPFKGARPHFSGESDASHDETESRSKEDSDSEGFIIDDDDDDIPTAQLPLVFSLTTHQDLTHHFKIVCQLFVHIAVQPLVDRRPFFERALKEEEYLSVPLQVTRRKLSGMRDSLVASSVWRPDFKKKLETYPVFILVPLSFTVPQCDACHLGGRVSTLLGRLCGKPYDKYDFEDVSDDESDEDQDQDSDEDEHIMEEFHLGRFCAVRTEVYHKFSHWEYSLYKALQRVIVEARNGCVGAIKPPRDLYDADKVMEWLDERGIIEREWQIVRQMIDSAHKLERGEIDGDMY